MMTNRDLTLVPYGRTSREKGRSKEVQERDYRAAVAREYEGHPNVRLLDWKFDHGTTGGKLAGRVALREALALVASGQADGIVCPEAKRFGRNTRESLNLIHALQHGGTFEGIDLPGGSWFFPLDVPGAEDPGNPDSKLALTIWLGIAERELDEHKLQWNGRKRRWAESGAYIGRAPLGYRHREHPKGSDPLGLEPDPKTAERVRQAFHLVITDGLADAARHLGLPPSKAAGPPMIYTDLKDPKRGRGVLRNPVYLGRTTWRDDRTGEVVRVDGAHEALVDVGTFHRVQQILDGDSSVSRRGASERYPLSHVPVCGRCGAGLVGSLSMGRRTYRCGSNSGVRDAVRCGTFANLRADEFEAYLPDALAEVVQARWDEAQAGPYAAVLDADAWPAPDDSPAQAALDAALLALEATRAAVANLPPSTQAAATADAERQVAEAQAAVDAMAAEQAVTWPTADEVRAARPSELPTLLSQFAVTVTVSPDRGTLAERVELHP